MNKILTASIIGIVFVVSNLFSKDILVSYNGDISQLVGLGALVAGYFIGKTVLKASATAK